MPTGVLEIGEYVDKILEKNYSGRSEDNTDNDDSNDKISILCVGERKPRNCELAWLQNAAMPYDIIRSIMIPFPPISTYILKEK
ncbi:MAG: hypothetical protein HY363_06005 [Candidatus Aenigmarchaeota archaeon]|nr:hypothetical protein [Candidatus Aenigmarchaeota archaeon]